MHRTTQWYPIKLKTQSAVISPLWGNTGLTSCSQSADGDWHHCIKLLQHLHTLWNAGQEQMCQWLIWSRVPNSSKVPQSEPENFSDGQWKCLCLPEEEMALHVSLVEKKIFFDFGSVFGYSWWEMYTSDSDKTYPDQHRATAVPSWVSSYNFEHSHLSLVIYILLKDK